MRSCTSCTDRRPYPIYASVAHRDARSHGYTRGSTALLRSSTNVPEPPVQRISRTYPDTPDQLQADAIPSRYCDCLARFAWSSDESARHSAIHELTTGFFCAAASIMSMRGYSTNRSVSRKQPCESCTLPKGSIWTVPTIRKQRRKRLLLRIQKATISA